MTPESSAPPTPVAAPAPAAIPPAPPSPPPAAHRSLLAWALWCVAGVIAIVVAYFGYHWWTYRLSHSITDDAFVEAHIVNVAPEMVSGRVVRFLVDENDKVEQGQVLAEIEPVHYRDQVEQAQGKLELAEAELKRQKAGVTKANLTLAKQEYDRFTELAAQDATTKRKAEEVTRANDAAKAELRLADARLAKAEAARTKIEVARRDLEVSQSLVAKAGKALDLAETGYDQIREVELLVGVKQESVKDAQIALTSAQHQFEFTHIRAPFPGVVVKRYRHLGDFVSAGTPILSMYNPDLIYVTANLEEDRLRGVAPGNPVELHLNAFDRPFQGRVVWINKSTGAEFALMPRNVVSGEFTWVVQRVPVRIAIEKDDRWPLLRAGLSVRAVLAHGAGDPQWAEQAAREMADLEARYNRAKE